MKKLNILFVVILSLFFFTQAWSDEVNLYSARKEHLIKPLINIFEKETGIKVNLVTAKAAQLHERILREGKNSPADVLLTTDAGNLWKASKQSLFQKINSDYLTGRIDSKYRDPDNKWFGLSLRARIIVYSLDRVDQNELRGYKYLSDPRFKSRILIRSSSNIYNQSLIAHMIAKYGEEVAEEWAEKLVNNFARSPAGGDRDQIKAIAAGEGDIAIVNSYYIIQMLNSDKKNIFNNLGIYFPRDKEMGVHINISGAGLLQNAPNHKNGKKLINFLLSDKAQKIYSFNNFEYPVVKNIEIPKLLKYLGNFKEDDIDTSEYGRLSKRAIKLADRVGWQ
jgi:iron(III) transport system substrate-binding protein